MSRSTGPLLIGLLALACVLAPPAEAAIIRGLAKILGGVLNVPAQILSGTFTGAPVVGTAVGAVNGVVGGVGMVASGLLDLAASAFSVAKTVGPFVIPFVL